MTSRLPLRVPLLLRMVSSFKALVYGKSCGVGDVAHLVERSLSMREALGSTPSFSRFFSDPSVLKLKGLYDSGLLPLSFFTHCASTKLLRTLPSAVKMCEMTSPPSTIIPPASEEVVGGGQSSDSRPSTTGSAPSIRTPAARICAVRGGGGTTDDVQNLLSDHPCGR
jgi:hypothetical protein